MLDPKAAVELFYTVLGEEIDGACVNPESPDEWLRRRAFVDGLYYGLFFAMKQAGWGNGVEPLIAAHERIRAGIDSGLQEAVGE